MSEYFYNSGKTLGRLHELSKRYKPAHRRGDFFEHYTESYIDELIPQALPLLRDKLKELIALLRGLERNENSYGLVHFDFSDGNYMIDYDTGDITVYDFDNACYCWYMFDLANLWIHGTGWIQFEGDPEKRRLFMDDYFATVLEGYRSETSISDEELMLLPVMTRAVLMEGIVDDFECARIKGEPIEIDEELSYSIACAEMELPYRGFFSDIYDSSAPFQAQPREL